VHSGAADRTQQARHSEEVIAWHWKIHSKDIAVLGPQSARSHS